VDEADKVVANLDTECWLEAQGEAEHAEDASAWTAEKDEKAGTWAG